MNNLNVSVVIATLGERDTLHRTLNSILKDGGNLFSGQAFMGGTRGVWVADNLTGSKLSTARHITSANGIDHIDPGSTFAHQVAAGVNAGIDMFMQPSNFEQFESTLIDLVNAGKVPMSRIDDAVSRILTKKFELGLFEHPYTDNKKVRVAGPFGPFPLTRSGRRRGR